MHHVDHCNSCQFNFKSAVGLLIASQVDIEKACFAGIIFGTMGHFTPKITGDQAAVKAGIGVASASLIFKGMEKGLRIKNNPWIEIPVTIACIGSADRLVRNEQH